MNDSFKWLKHFILLSPYHHLICTWHMFATFDVLSLHLAAKLPSEKCLDRLSEAGLQVIY